MIYNLFKKKDSNLDLVLDYDSEDLLKKSLLRLVNEVVSNEFYYKFTNKPEVILHLAFGAVIINPKLRKSNTLSRIKYATKLIKERHMGYIMFCYDVDHLPEGWVENTFK